MTTGPKHFSLVAAITLALAALFSAPGGAARHLSGQGTPSGCDFPLPNASEVGVPAFEKLLYAFLETGCYQRWVHDREIRNTGPFIDNQNFGTHPAVKVFYSPQVWEWMHDRKREGAISDGAMIVKEMYSAPASAQSKLEGWTVMVRDAAGSWDGWFWSYHAPGEAPNKPGDYPDSGFGLYCVRCHASAERQLTFSALRNVEQDPISFVTQVPTMGPEPPAGPSLHRNIANAGDAVVGPLERPHDAPSPEFLRLFGFVASVTGAAAAADGLAFPPESFDHVVPGPGGPDQFITSDQCIGCHSASSQNMAYPFEDPKRAPVNLSPYTEWRASMMGLAGRDPIFHAQLETEKALWPHLSGTIDDTCFRCHGVMGQRQLHLDRNAPFPSSAIYAHPGSPDAKYGALARDGVSCAVCHRIGAEGLGTPSTFTGMFKVDPAGTVNGPFKDVATLPMKQALGIEPRYAPQIGSSALCGSCHTVVLPVLDAKGNKIKEIYEQTTYLEWLNSSFQNERAPWSAETARSCQNCHMPERYDDRRLTYRIANIEDTTYPFVDNRAADKEITLSPRDTYSRHTLAGINVFALTMFNQFSDLLGIRPVDYMYGEGVPGLTTSRDSAVRLARTETARIEITGVTRSAGTLETVVRVTNLAGHCFPSGVEFRRAFLEFQVLDAHGAPLWASGRTSPLGVILEGRTSRSLRTEFLKEPSVHQPHYQVIEREDQVQIYEELVASPEGELTTNFLNLDTHVKNNRLLPRGWSSDGPYADVSGPLAGAKDDPDYRDGSGADSLIYRVPLGRIREAASVRVTLYYQAIPPYYLAQRFGQARGRDIQRLAHIASRLRVAGTPIEDWKLEITRATRAVAVRGEARRRDPAMRARRP